MVVLGCERQLTRACLGGLSSTPIMARAAGKEGKMVLERGIWRGVKDERENTHILRK